MNQFEDSSREEHEFEARLQSIRPRPAKVDVDRLLLETGTDDVRSAVVASDFRRSWLTIAGAWSCGATVGAIAVFVLMQTRIAELTSAESESRPKDQIVSKVELIESDRPDDETSSSDSSVNATTNRSYATSTVDAPHWRAQWLSHGNDSSALAVGSHLRSLADRISAADADNAFNPANGEVNSEFESDTGNVQPPVTRAWLLKELRSI